MIYDANGRYDETADMRETPREQWDTYLVSRWWFMFTNYWYWIGFRMLLKECS